MVEPRKSSMDDGILGGVVDGSVRKQCPDGPLLFLREEALVGTKSGNKLEGKLRFLVSIAGPDYYVPP